MTRLTLSGLGWACALSAAIPCVAVAQVTQPVPDASLERLALAESRVPLRLSDVVYDDAGLRAEIRRIGFEKGCRAVADSRREVSAVFAPKLVPATVAAIRHVVPAERLNEMRVLSFFMGPLRVYTSRIETELDATAGPLLQSAYAAMRESFLARATAMPTVQDASANRVMPKADIAAAVGIKGAYDLDRPAQLGMACAELLISPSVRPTISTTPQPVLVVAPPR